MKTEALINFAVCTADLCLCFGMYTKTWFSCDKTNASFSHIIAELWVIFEPHRERKRILAYAKAKAQISFTVTAKLISAFVFATLIVQFLFFVNPKFQASSLLLRLYRSVCVRLGRKPLRTSFLTSQLIYCLSELSPGENNVKASNLHMGKQRCRSGS